QMRQSEAQMSQRSRSRNIHVARAAAPVLSVIAGSVLLSLPSARADAIWSDSSGDWNVSSNWLSTNGTVLPPGTGVVATPNTGPATFIGSGGGVHNVTITSVSGSGSIAYRKNTGATVTFDIAGNNTWAGSMSPAGNGTATSAYGILAKTGVGTLTLTNTQNLKREIQASGGTLVLDYSTLPTGLLDDDAGISLRGGTLKLSGNGGTTTEVMGT